MDINTYIAATEREYRMRIKTIAPVDDAILDGIERLLAKYDLVEITQPKKTILQSNPLDFPNVQAAEVWIIDLVCRLPASPSVVREDVRKLLGVPEAFVVVRNDSDALEVETLRLGAVADIEDEAKRRGLVPAALMSIDPAYVEQEEVDGSTLFGDAYNGMLLGYLAKVRDERPDPKVKTDSMLFDFEKMPESDADTTDFNAGIKDAPKVSPKRVGKLKPKPIQQGAATAGAKVSRVYKDAKGKKVVLSRTLGDDA